VSIGTTTGALTFNVTGLTQNTTYAFTVTATDAAGNVSPVSNTANVTTLTAADGQAPTAPSNLAANGTTTTTTNLSWTASTDNIGVTGYTIFQDGVSIGTTTGALTFNVTGLTQNT
ncbi:secretion protein, partial [Arenibacter sp. F20364]|nr:secretion protein [Arenibacter sp. F20364]